MLLTLFTVFYRLIYVMDPFPFLFCPLWNIQNFHFRFGPYITKNTVVLGNFGLFFIFFRNKLWKKWCNSTLTTVQYGSVSISVSPLTKYFHFPIRFFTMVQKNFIVIFLNYTNPYLSVCLCKRDSVSFLGI